MNAKDVEDHAMSDSLVAVTPETENQILLRKIVTNPGSVPFWTSLPITNRAERVKAYNLTTSTNNDVRELLAPHGVEVKDVILSAYEFTDEEGKVVKGTKIVLIDTAGIGKTVLSTIFVREVCKLFAVFGPPPFDPALRIGATEEQLAGGRRYYRPVLIES